MVYPGDVRKQTNRMWENVEALLKEAECSLMMYHKPSSICATQQTILSLKNCLTINSPHLPHVIVHAPVCRPKWLIEMECIAVKSDKNEEFKDF